ncbi:hypothetical protein SAMN02745181_3825 [Rubritalea squalenifaciens DSM 18772]|uniref:Uncharacterized protein n=1 Tax=Rubritalea squalenifaciens DSM 18772 TaxID=1123071 RepID=A0A1M6SH51_9BACT|nr:hypothetical protein [Rubritalea squalenifaciens]SHK44084.1 hypothetical protein SAMN02745181_3825 [Rubritalea squalenifaciens DSM 18772]
MSKGFFHTTGECIFSPPLGSGGGIVRRDGRTTEWWMILLCDAEIGSYMREMYRRATHGVHKLNEPLWGTHVSVIRDERPSVMEYWMSLEGKEVSLSYSNHIELHAGYAVVEVRCDPILDYREKLGLAREPEWPLHMTIGNLK